MKTELPKVTHVITGLGDGGAEGALYRLLTTRNNFDDEVIALSDIGKYGPLLRQAGFRVTALDFKATLTPFSHLINLFRAIKESRPDIVQTWMYHADLFGGMAARLLGIKRVFWGIRHSTFSKAAGTNTAHIIAKVSAPLSRFIPEKIICAGDSAKVAHAKMGYQESKMMVIPNGYELSHMKKAPSQRQEFRSEMAALGADITMPIIGYVARFNEQKDHQNLFNALAKVHEFGHPTTLVLVGSGISSDNTTLTAQIIESGINPEHVFLLGQREDIPRIMNGLDLHVMSSAFGEAFPNVLAEAMACGTPCVSTDVGDAATIIGDTGWIVNPSDPNSLGEAIFAALDESLNKPEVWKLRTEAARIRIQAEFSIERMVGGFEAAWRNGLTVN